MFCETPQQSWQPSRSPLAGDRLQHIRSMRPAGLDGAAAAGSESPGEGEDHHSTHTTVSSDICVQSSCPTLTRTGRATSPPSSPIFPSCAAGWVPCLHELLPPTPFTASYPASFRSDLTLDASVF